MLEHIVDGEVGEALSMSEQEPTPVANPCVNFGKCGNVAPGNNDICPECLDEARQKDRDEGPRVP